MKKVFALLFALALVSTASSMAVAQDSTSNKKSSRESVTYGVGDGILSVSGSLGSTANNWSSHSVYLGISGVYDHAIYAFQTSWNSEKDIVLSAGGGLGANFVFVTNTTLKETYTSVGVMVTPRLLAHYNVWDNLFVYTGLSLGVYKSDLTFFMGGVPVGLRYMFTPKFGVFAEAGFSTTVSTGLGVSFGF